MIVVVHRIALYETAAHHTQHEVREWQARALTVECELAIRRTIVQRLDVRMDPIGADRELVGSADDVDVVCNLVRLGVEVAGIRAASANRKAVAVDADAHITGHKAENLTAQI